MRIAMTAVLWFVFRVLLFAVAASLAYLIASWLSLAMHWTVLTATTISWIVASLITALQTERKG